MTVKENIITSFFPCFHPQSCVRLLNSHTGTCTCIQPFTKGKYSPFFFCRRPQNGLVWILFTYGRNTEEPRHLPVAPVHTQLATTHLQPLSLGAEQVTQPWPPRCHDNPSVFSSFVSKTSSSTQPTHWRCAEMERLESSTWVSLQRFLLGIFIHIDMPGWEST